MIVAAITDTVMIALLSALGRLPRGAMSEKTAMARRACSRPLCAMGLFGETFGCAMDSL